MLIPEKPNEENIKYILENLRPEDKHECVNYYGDNYIQEIMKTVMANTKCYVVGRSGESGLPVVFGGIQPDINNMSLGVCCMLSTSEVSKHILFLLKYIKRVIHNADKHYALLYNCIWRENQPMKALLKNLGFTFLSAPRDMAFGEDYEFFFRLRKINGLE